MFDYNEMSGFGMMAGIVSGAALALIFAATGNPGLIGVGAILGFSIGSSLSKRFKQ